MTSVKNMESNKYYKYQLIYPFQSVNVYKSQSISAIVGKCYREFFKNRKDNENEFHIANLDKNIIYKFQIK